MSSLFYTTAELGIIQESYGFWMTKTDHLHACALVANEGGETGYKWSLVNGVMRTPEGDHDEATGIFQWHAPRAAAILENSGYDVVHGTHLDMLNGAYAEMTGAWSHPYSKVWPALIATTDLESAIAVLVEKEEQSASQASDIVKRTAIAVYLDGLLGSQQ